MHVACARARVQAYTHASERAHAPLCPLWQVRRYPGQQSLPSMLHQQQHLLFGEKIDELTLQCHGMNNLRKERQLCQA